MVKIIYRYLGSNFALPFMVSTVFFVAFLLTFQLFRITQLVIAKGVPLVDVGELVMHIAISFIPMAVPLSILFASMFALNRLSEDSEIVAARSFGHSKFHLFIPFLIISILVAGAIYSLNRSIIPFSKRKFKNTIILLTSQGMLENIKPEQFFTDIPNVTLFAKTVDEGGLVLGNVFIHNRGKEDQVIMAKKGVLVKQEGAAQTPSIRLHLFEGNIVKSNMANGNIQKILFNQYDFPIFQQDSKPGFVNKDSTRTSTELDAYINEMELKKAGALRLLKTRPLSPEESREFDQISEALPNAKLEFWERINSSFLCVVFTLLGFSLGIKHGRGKSRNTGGLALLAVICYYSIYFIGVAMAKKYSIPQFLVIFFPTALTALLAIRYYKKLDWVS